MFLSFFYSSLLHTCLNEEVVGSNVAIISSSRESLSLGFRLINLGYNVSFGNGNHPRYIITELEECPINYIKTNDLFDYQISKSKSYSSRLTINSHNIYYFIWGALLLILLYISTMKYKVVLYRCKDFKLLVTNKIYSYSAMKNGPYKSYDNEFSDFKSRVILPASKHYSVILKWRTKCLPLSTIGQFEIPFSCYFITDEIEKIQEFPAIINTATVPGNCTFNVTNTQITCSPVVTSQILHSFSKLASSIYLLLGFMTRTFCKCSSIEELRNLFGWVSHAIDCQSSMFLILTGDRENIIHINGDDDDQKALRSIIPNLCPPNDQIFTDFSVTTLNDKRVYGGGVKIADSIVITAYLRHWNTSVIRGPERAMTQLLALFFGGAVAKFIRSPARRFDEYKEKLIPNESPDDRFIINYDKFIISESIGTVFNDDGSPLFSQHSDRSLRLIRLIPKGILERRKSCFLKVSHLTYMISFFEHGGYILQLQNENDNIKFTANFGMDCLIWVIAQRRKETLFSSLGIDFWKFVEKLSSGDSKNVEAAVTHVLQYKDSSLTAEFHYCGRHYQVNVSCTCADLLRIVALSTDDRSKREQEVRDIEKSVSIALSTGRVSIWSYDDTENPVRVYSQWPDPRATSIANRSTIMFNIPMEYQENVFSAFKTCIADKKPFSIDAPVMMNTVRWFSIRGIRSGPTSILLLMIDITATKNAEEHLRIEKARFVDAATAKTRFLANMSHEIRNPLNGMSGLLELLMSTDVVQKYSDNMEILSDSFQSLLELLNDILDLAKIEQNQMHPSFTDFDPLQVLADSLNKQMKQAAKNGILFNPIIDPKLATVVHGDPHIFARVASNLVSNAVKFTKKGSITISVSSDDNLKLIIADTGIGISHDFQQKIFGIFLQGDNSITRSYGGIGVGLALVNKMLQLINGHITLKSDTGRGTTFTITFPYESELIPFIPSTLKNKQHHQILNLAGQRVFQICQPHCEFFCHDLISDVELINEHLSLILIENKEECIEQVKEIMKKYPDVQIANVLGPEIPQTVLNNVINVRQWIKDLPRLFSDLIWRKKIMKKKMSIGNHLKVLLAEDNATNQLVMRKVFEKLATDAVIVDNGADALKMLNNERFDVVILDQHMPVMDGPSCARAIRESGEKWSKIPIVALTASHSKEDENACLSAGMDSFLTKPITIRMIQSLIEKYEK